MVFKTALYVCVAAFIILSLGVASPVEKTVGTDLNYSQNPGQDLLKKPIQDNGPDLKKVAASPLKSKIFACTISLVNKNNRSGFEKEINDFLANPGIEVVGVPSVTSKRDQGMDYDYVVVVVWYREK